MKVITCIKRVADGVLAVYEQDWGEDHDPSHAEFMWTDGNYGCDCNRKLFFDRSRGDDREGVAEDGRECGHGAYAVRVFADGKLIVGEFEDHP